MEADRLFRSIFLLVLWWLHQSAVCAEQFCLTTNGQNKCDDDKNIRLTRMEGKKVVTLSVQYLDTGV